MSRIALAVMFVLAAPLAFAQTPIQWNSNLEEGVATSKRTLKPLLFYVPGDGGDRRGNLRKMQDVAFSTPIVKDIATDRYVPVRLAMNSSNMQMMADMGAPTGYGLYLAAVTPGGKLIGLIRPSEAAEVQSLVRSLTGLFRRYRSGLFEREFKPILENAEAPIGELERVLQLVREFIIVEADDAVADLLKRRNLPPGLQKDVYNTLSCLSTPRSISALFEAALTDKVADAALDSCTPGGAEFLLAELRPDEPERFHTAYQAVTRACRIPDARAATFWRDADAESQQKEIDRVSDLVRQRAAAWRQQVADIR